MSVKSATPCAHHLRQISVWRLRAAIQLKIVRILIPDHPCIPTAAFQNTQFGACKTHQHTKIHLTGRMLSRGKMSESFGLSLAARRVDLAEPGYKFDHDSLELVGDKYGHNWEAVEVGLGVEREVPARTHAELHELHKVHDVGRPHADMVQLNRLGRHTSALVPRQALASQLLRRGSAQPPLPLLCRSRRPKQRRR